MNAPARLAGFAATLALLTAGGAALGSAIDPERSGARHRSDHRGTLQETKRCERAGGPAAAAGGGRDGRVLTATFAQEAH